MDFMQLAPYAVVGLGSFSAGYAVLSAGGRMPAEKGSRIITAVIVGLMITVAAYAADLAAGEYAGVPGLFYGAFAGLTLLAAGLLKLTGIKVKAPEMLTPQPQLQQVEVPPVRMEQTAQRAPDSHDGTANTPLWSDFNGHPVKKSEKLDLMVGAEPKDGPDDGKRGETARLVPAGTKFLPSPDESKDGAKEIMMPAMETAAAENPAPRPPAELVVERISINKGVEKIAQPAHPRRLYEQKQTGETILKEEKPPAELPAAAVEPARRPKPISEKEEFELVSKDLREQLKRRQYEGQETAIDKAEAPETTAKPAPKAALGIREPAKPESPASQAISIGDLMGGKPAAQPPAAPQSEAKSLFDTMAAIGAPAQPQSNPRAAAPFDKGSCPNCNAKTGRVVFCPHCGNGMCASCATSITPGPDGFEYVCPTCGEKVAVKKKAA